MPVQGNVDPQALLAGGAALDREVDAVLQAFGSGPLIFNLGHGILPQTPIAHVERMLKRVSGCMSGAADIRLSSSAKAEHPVGRSACEFSEGRDYWIARLRGQ